MEQAAGPRAQTLLGICDVWGCELFAGDRVYDIEGLVVCEDCLPRFASRYWSDCARKAGDEAGDLSPEGGGAYGSY